MPTNERAQPPSRLEMLRAGKAAAADARGEESAAPRRPWPPVYDQDDIDRAIGLWENGHVNAHGQRPWREDYQAAVREVLPALDGYGTLQELVHAYYGAEVHAAVERACQLADGRILSYTTVEGAAYWERLPALQARDRDAGGDREGGAMSTTDDPRCELDGCDRPALDRCAACNRRFCLVHAGPLIEVILPGPPEDLERITQTMEYLHCTECAALLGVTREAGGEG